MSLVGTIVLTILDHRRGLRGLPTSPHIDLHSQAQYCNVSGNLGPETLTSIATKTWLPKVGLVSPKGGYQRWGLVSPILCFEIRADIGTKRHLMARGKPILGQDHEENIQEQQEAEIILKGERRHIQDCKGWNMANILMQIDTLVARAAEYM